MRLPFADQAGIAQLHGFLKAANLTAAPLGWVVPHANGDGEWPTGLREIGRNWEG